MTFNWGDLIIGALITTEDLAYIKHNVKKVVLKAEIFFYTVFVDWVVS